MALIGSLRLLSSLLHWDRTESFISSLNVSQIDAQCGLVGRSVADNDDSAQEYMRRISE